MTAKILVVCEARADFEISSELADRVAVEKIEWLDEGLLSAVRAWWGPDATQTFVRWQDLGKLSHGTHGRIRTRSRFSGEPGAADAKAGDKALQFAVRNAAPGELAAVVLIRDSDGDDERRRGLEQARVRDDGHTWPFAVVVGVAHPKREAWVLAGFTANDDGERVRLAEVQQELGHDPCSSAERIDARTHGSLRDIKRVLDRLTNDDVTREGPCWREAPLEQLRQRGRETGLAAYLMEVEQRLVPLLGAR